MLFPRVLPAWRRGVEAAQGARDPRPQETGAGCSRHSRALTPVSHALEGAPSQEVGMPSLDPTYPCRPVSVPGRSAHHPETHAGASRLL